jgi:hypothetical protein
MDPSHEPKHAHREKDPAYPRRTGTIQSIMTILNFRGIGWFLLRAGETDK